MRLIIFSMALVLLILVSVPLLAEGIDPEKYQVVLGSVLNLEGEVRYSREDGELIPLSSGDKLSSQNVTEYFLHYSDLKKTLIEGRNTIRETLTIETMDNSNVVLQLNDIASNDNKLSLGSNTVIEIMIDGGCAFIPEAGEGYTLKGVKWEPLTNSIRMNLKKGEIEYSSVPTENISFNGLETANLLIDLPNYGRDAAVSFKLTAAKKTGEEGEVLVDESSPEIREILDSYQVDSIEELNDELKAQLMEYINIMNETLNSAEYTQYELDLVTTVRVMEGEITLSGKGGWADNLLVNAGETYQAIGNRPPQKQ